MPFFYFYVYHKAATVTFFLKRRKVSAEDNTAQPIKAEQLPRKVSRS